MNDTPLTPEGLKDEIKNLITKLGTRIAELERENARLLNIIEKKNELISDLNVKLHQSGILNETMMRLLEWQVRDNAFGNGILQWQSYCKEHGLPSPINKNV